MLHYCKKCGRIIEIDIYDKRNNFNCDCCNSIVRPIPNIFLDKDLDCCFKDKATEQQFIDEYIKVSPEFDKYLFDHRDELLAKKSAEFDAKMEHGKAVLEGKDKGNPYGVTCPNCKATNVRKITITNKAIHTSIFGIWSIGRNEKQWHCDHCGSEF